MFSTLRRSLPGYLGSFLFDAEGGLVTDDRRSPMLETALIGLFLTALFDVAQVVEPSPLANVEFLSIDCEAYVLMARWVDETRARLLALAIEKDGNLGQARYRMTIGFDEIRRSLLAGPESAASDAARGR